MKVLSIWCSCLCLSASLRVRGSLCMCACVFVVGSSVFLCAAVAVLHVCDCVFDKYTPDIALNICYIQFKSSRHMRGCLQKGKCFIQVAGFLKKSLPVRLAEQTILLPKQNAKQRICNLTATTYKAIIKTDCP